ncbi:MAG: ATP phosphoribosyltransferase regulatory subunit, partial [Candidatus Korarchaeota archaeon]
MSVQRLPGFRDIYGDMASAYEKILDVLKKIAFKYGFTRYIPPTLEPMELYSEKLAMGLRMYRFKDLGERDVVIRPEVTASFVRMLLEENLATSKRIKVWYFTHCMRYDRPQHGRYREFYQFGWEIFPLWNRVVDNFQNIYMVSVAAKHLGLPLVIRIGNIRIIKRLMEKYNISGEMGELFLSRIDEGNINEAIELLPPEGKALADCLQLIEFEKFSKLLEAFSDDLIKEELDVMRSVEKMLSKTLSDSVPRFYSLSVVRGWDYYTGITIEVDYPPLKASKQIGGGGEYSISLLPNKTGTGFAWGF